MAPHTPALQVAVPEATTGHLVVQLPQALTLVLRSTQLVPHRVLPTGQVPPHFPFVQVVVPPAMVGHLLGEEGRGGEGGGVKEVGSKGGG